MIDDVKGVSVYNPAKQISDQVTGKTVIMHDAAMKLARTGIPESLNDQNLKPNERINLRFKGLQEVISLQQSMITNIARPIIKINCINRWQNEFKKDEEKEQTPFEEEDNDYNELMGILYFLDECEQKIILSKQTKKLEDDFILEKTDHEGETILELTHNFFEMFKELEESFETIYGLLLKHKIVSNGLDDDEEKTNRELEEEMIKRVVEA
jgi:hypothetical protein